MIVCKYYGHKNLIEIIRLLIENGIDVDCRSKYGSNALLCFCQNRIHTQNCVEIVRLLIKKKIDINAIDGDGDNALTLLCFRSKCDKLKDIICVLLDVKSEDNRNIDLNHKNKNGLTAVDILLDKREFSKESAVIRLLVSRGFVLNY
jgi:ankyrin repeat protein